MTTHTEAGNVWAAGLHTRIAATFRAARIRRGLSAQDVADETTRLGYPVTRSQIANYESGRKRTLDVAEVLSLAAGLGVPPLALLFGPNALDTTEVLPGVPMRGIDAIAWFTGAGGAAPDGMSIDKTSYAAMDLAFEIVTVEKRLADIRRTVAERESSPSRFTAPEEMRAHEQRALDQGRQEIEILTKIRNEWIDSYTRAVANDG